MPDTPQDEDQTAIRLSRISQGDESALAALIDEHLPAIRAYVRLNMTPFLRSRETVSDIVQSVCREVLRQEAVEYRGVGQFKCWLFRAVLFRIRDKEKHYRAEKRGGRAAAQPDSALLRSYASFLTPSRFAEAKEEIERVERAFETLGESDAELLSLVHVALVPKEEVARQLGVSGETLNKRLSRAKIKLLRILDDGA